MKRFFCFLLCLLFTAAAQAEPKFELSEVKPGLELGSYWSLQKQTNFKSEIIIVKIDPKHFRIDAALASDHGAKLLDVKSLTKKSGAMLGINTNFFDTNNDPLGVIVKSGKVKQPMHRGGGLLTGVFFLENTTPRIVHRDHYQATGSITAFQSGPRIIAGGKALKLKNESRSSRRSGIAVTTDSKILLFATANRFPGATLAQLTAMLLDPRLKVIDALNFDGGGSSQLYIAPATGLTEQFITGGDRVPVALVIKPKES